jgi:hypothetical protein
MPSAGSVDLKVAAGRRAGRGEITTVIVCPAVTVLAAVAAALAEVALLTATADRPVTFVPAIFTATVKLPPALPTA